MSISIPNDRILGKLVPYLVATRLNLPYLDPAPFGLEIPPYARVDPMRTESTPFLDLLHVLDRDTFGPAGMPMPKWVFYDAAELPGAIFGFARPARQLSAEARARFAVHASYDGLVPYSMFIAIPMLQPGGWMGHNLASANRSLPAEGLAGLASATKAIGLKAFRTRVLYGATQWRSPALHIHVRFGPLDLVTAWTPAHSAPCTLTYRIEISDACLLAAAAGSPIARPAPTRFVDPEDHASLVQLHAEVRAGTRLRIVAAPRRDGARTVVPIA